MAGGLSHAGQIEGLEYEHMGYEGLLFFATSTIMSTLATHTADVIAGGEVRGRSRVGAACMTHLAFVAFKSNQAGHQQALHSLTAPRVVT